MTSTLIVPNRRINLKGIIMIKGWKTLAFAGLTGLLAMFSTPEMGFWVAENLAWFGPLMSGFVVALRALTNSSIFKNTSPAPLP